MPNKYIALGVYDDSYKLSLMRRFHAKEGKWSKVWFHVVKFKKWWDDNKQWWDAGE